MSKVKLEVGMCMKCATYGEGKITALHSGGNRDIALKIGESYYKYFNDGRYHNGTLPTLKLLNIPFTEGLEVECDIYGKGVVYAVNPDKDTALSILVQLADGRFIHYTLDGRIDLKANQTLFSKYEI
jgi:hypothetical protein